MVATPLICSCYQSLKMTDSGVIVEHPLYFVYNCMCSFQVCVFVLYSFHEDVHCKLFTHAHLSPSLSLTPPQTPSLAEDPWPSLGSPTNTPRGFPLGSSQLQPQYSMAAVAPSPNPPPLQGHQLPVFTRAETSQPAQQQITPSPHLPSSRYGLHVLACT